MRWLIYIFISLLFFSCSTQGLDGVRCFKKRKYKTKTYKVKKIRSVQRPVYSSSRSTSLNRSSASPEQTINYDEEGIEIPNNADNKSPNDVVVIDTLKSETEPILSNTALNVQPIEIDDENTMQNRSDSASENQNTIIATNNSEKRYNTQAVRTEPRVDTQSQISPIQPSNVIEIVNSELLNATIITSKPNLTFTFRDEKIDISEGYSFNELIHFIINQDELLEPKEAVKQIKDLSDLLKKHPQIQVTITANTATDEPHPSHKYGADEETLTTMWETKADSTDHFTNLKQLMIARAKRIEELLIQNGVNPNQLTYELGTHNMWKYQRYVTFDLNDGK